MRGSKNEETLDFSRVSWCGKQDLKRPRAINLKQYKCQKALFFNGFCQFEKIWENHEKRQLHSQLHSNCIQKMAVPTLPRTTTCSSSMAGLFSLLMMGASLLFPIRRSRNQKTQSKQVRLSQTGCIDYPQNSIQPVCFHILLFIIKYDWDG